MIEKLEQELAELKEKEFMLQMCDHWDSSDYRYSWELHNKIKAITEKINKLKGGE